MIFISFVLIIEVLFITNGVATDYPEIETELGKIRGTYGVSVQGRTYSAFQGVPYAEPPIGKYRLVEAQPVKPWNGVWVANTTHKCLQFDHFSKAEDTYNVVGDEDCLYLNIYVPKVDKNEGLDVIVVIHGGAFMFGNGQSFGPEVIMDKNVVYVNLNYRLGILGFLSTEDNIIPGNFGLKDQLLALKWIKKHIEAFGGNPESITISGMSAGGASVHIHYLSPLSEGLFNRGISQSGTALNPWVLVENSREKAEVLASHLGCSFISSEEILECLRQRSARQIVALTRHFIAWYYNPFSPFGVVVDKWSKNPILPEHPLILLKNRKLRNIPWIFSMVESEGLYPAAEFLQYPNSLKELNENWETLLPFLLDFNHTVDLKEQNSVVQKIRDHYFNGKSASRETFVNVLKMIGDRLFAVDIEESAKLQAAGSDGSVYFYYFSYRGVHSRSEILAKRNENYGAGHLDDTLYVLTTFMQKDATESERKMTEIMKNIWTTFAHNGKPLVKGVDWLPVSKREDDPIQYLDIRSPNDIKMNSSEDLGNRKFWNSLPFKENLRLFHERDEL
ncbi:venom carboxylesterase-6-like [Agrilus planipennis]|uniref:Carboxylic ester hydrolase n=1 Tax=Agrilus planipennis TaxID=224129 RepID=A0A7F5R4U7_AGRPL|nr:venom carboxylesterase-6-like [Agrilus planipennis]